MEIRSWILYTYNGERHTQLNIKNAIITGVFHDKCYPLTDSENDSYYSDMVSTFSNDSNNSMPGLNDRASEDSSSDEDSMTVADEDNRSEYYSTENNNTVYEGSAYDASSHTQKIRIFEQ